MLNFPNTLSLIRILIAISAPFFLIEGSLWIRIIAGILCLIAITTDFIDGWYARKYNQVTTLGKILDPIADKVLVLTTLSVFVYLNVLSIWWIVPIFIREIVVTGYRFIFLNKDIIIAASKSGKIKTVMQMITIGIIYIWFMMHRHFSQYMSDYFTYLMYACLIITVYHTISSGYSFFKSNWKIIKKYHEIA